MVFETQRLFARVWQLDDAEAAFRIYGDPEVTRYIGGHTEPDLDAMVTKLEFLIERNRNLPEGHGSFSLILKQTDEIVGAALLKELPNADSAPSGDIEIGWHLARCHWKQGFATEAGFALLEHGFQLGLSELHAVVDSPNTASRRVAERLGMRHVGQSTRYYGGVVVEHFVLSRAEWLNRI
jgi:ribosomal-protein-alanine N-acetyltransferase